MAVITVCKNVIVANNKRKWVDPEPPIRIAKTKGGKATGHAHVVVIYDRRGNPVATIKTTQDGKPIVKCGAKVAIFTEPGCAVNYA